MVIRIISIVLIFLYSSVQGIGMSFNLHYCGSEITDINLLDTKSDCCCANDTSLQYSCCDDEQVYAKDNSEHAAATKLSIEKVEKSLVTSLICQTGSKCISCSKYTRKYSGNSPPLSQQHSWLLFSTLRL
jgi:hypothetical protein